MASEESFRSAVSSTNDLMTLSPKRIELDGFHQQDMKNDFLTDTEFDSMCNVTMLEVPIHDNTFIDSRSLDFLEKYTESNNQTLVDRGKDSLFVKFDPLYAQVSLSDSTDEKSPEDLLENDIGYETGSTHSALTDNYAADSTGSMASKCGINKPTQVVCPVISSTPVLVRSVSAILTPTQVGPERLINIYGNTPPTEASSSRCFKYSGVAVNEHYHFQSLKVILEKQEQELLQLRRERTELLATNEEQCDKILKLTNKVEALVQKENHMEQQLHGKTLNNRRMSVLMEEFINTIKVLIAEKDEMAADKDQALEHLSSMESSFKDLLIKYERCKIVIQGLKDNENQLQQTISEYKIAIKKNDDIYNNLKQITSEELQKANETLEKINKTHNIEITKLNAIIKKHEITISSQQESLAQKDKNIKDLSKICDGLIKNVQ